MKTLNRTTTTTLALALIMGSASLSFAGNIPAVTYPQGALVTSSSSVQMTESTPWHKGTAYASGIVVAGPAYHTCPVSHVALNSKHPGVVVALSNGKLIMLSSAGLKSVVEADLNKYKPYMYGGAGTVDSSVSYASLGKTSFVK